jgi:hypothetical protein
MKNLLLSTSILLANVCGFAQITDTVSQNAGYANQVWYNLQNGNENTAPKNNWHIAFETANQSSSIHINSAAGVELWLHPANDTALWTSLDTSGIQSWNKFYNDNKSWSIGAFNAPADTNNQFDLGWGLYSMITHTVTGNKLFVIKIGSNTYQKIWIKSLASGVYTFRHANLDNTGDMTHTITKSSYQTKNFIYFDLINHQVIDREPAANTWDLTFTQYIEYIPTPYLVTGILHNKNVESVKVYPVDETTYELWSNHSFSNHINTIGYDWKSFNNQNFQWNIADSTVYFVKDLASNIWKIVFTGFGGSSNGNYILTKKLLSATNINETELQTPFMHIYPNPANGFVNIVSYNLSALSIYDLNGKLIYTQAVNNSNFDTHRIDISFLNKGIYLIEATHHNASKAIQKLIIQ